MNVANEDKKMLRLLLFFSTWIKKHPIFFQISDGKPFLKRPTLTTEKCNLNANIGSRLYILILIDELLNTLLHNSLSFLALT